MREQMIDTNFLKEIIEDACDLNGSDEAMRWKDWFINTIDVVVRMENKTSIKENNLVVVTGMKMPKSCNVCPFYIVGGYRPYRRCLFTGNIFLPYNRREVDCPLKTRKECIE